MNWPIRTRDYLFVQDLKLQESLQIFYYAISPHSHMFSTTNLYWHCRESFSTLHHLIFVLINRELLTSLRKKEEKCECDWPSLANGMVGWSLYVVWPFYTCPASLNSSNINPSVERFQEFFSVIAAQMCEYYFFSTQTLQKHCICDLDIKTTIIQNQWAMKHS